MLDLIYDQFFHTTHHLEHLSTTFRFLQPLTVHMLVLAAISIHCMLFEYATAKNLIVMFSQDEYEYKFCPLTG